MRLIGIVVYPNFRLIGLAAATVFEIANSLRDSLFYDVRIVSEGGGLVRSSIGVSVQTELSVASNAVPSPSPRKPFTNGTIFIFPAESSASSHSPAAMVRLRCRRV